MAALERGVCQVCGRNVAVKVPRGGDGSMVVPVRHYADAPPLSDAPCAGIWQSTKPQPVNRWSDPRWR